MNKDKQWALTRACVNASERIFTEMERKRLLTGKLENDPHEQAIFMHLLQRCIKDEFTKHVSDD